jgi:hypothetical protein
MNRGVTQSVESVYLNSAKLSEKLSETLRDIFFYLLVSPMKGMRCQGFNAGHIAGRNISGKPRK